jgi:Tfp pilus assembly protein PilO
MKGTDKAVLLGVVIALVLVGFYLKVLSPKRDEASKLEKQNTELQAQIEQQEQVAAFAEEARQHFPVYYGRLVVLGKAVPEQADTASMLVQLNTISSRSGVKFEGLELSASGGGVTAVTAAPSATAPSQPASGTGTTPTSTGTSTTPTTGTTTTPTTTGGSSSGATSTTTPTTTAPATEASAASLPIGASVGPAGLPILPYNLTLQGSFFDFADFLASIDSLVNNRDGTTVVADGRLVTIDGFALSNPTAGPSPTLDANLAVTMYVTPSNQGLTAGATPTGPAPVVGGAAPAQAATVAP